LSILSDETSQDSDEDVLSDFNPDKIGKVEALKQNHAACFIQRLWRFSKPSHQVANPGEDERSESACRSDYAYISPHQVKMELGQPSASFGGQGDRDNMQADSILIEALEARNTELCSVLIKQAGYRLINYLDALGRTALHHAAQHDMAHVCKAILDHKMFDSADTVHWGGWTALHMAARHGHEGPVRVILASPKFHRMNAEDGDGRTALHCAAVSGNLGVISAILAQPNFTMVDAHNNGGFSALHVAERHGHADACKLIGDHGKEGANALARVPMSPGKRASVRNSCIVKPLTPGARPRQSILTQQIPGLASRTLEDTIAE
jgi:ankyrin repeat protein